MMMLPNSVSKIWIRDYGMYGVDFTEIKWKPDREIGFAERRGEDE